MITKRMAAPNPMATLSSVFNSPFFLPSPPSPPGLTIDEEDDSDDTAADDGFTEVPWETIWMKDKNNGQRLKLSF